jgi:phage nucleotide-binding protein
VSDEVKFGGLIIRKAQELAEATGLVTVVYGAPGSGKTTLMSQAAGWEGKKALLLDADSGTRSVTGIEDLDIIGIDSWAQLEAVNRALVSESHSYGTVIYDNMSEYQALSIRSIAGNNPPEIQHWNRSTADMMRTTRFGRDLAKNKGINVGFIAWEAPEKDESTGIIKRDLGFTPSLARQFPGIVDIIGYLTVANDGRRVLSFEPSNRSAAKFRRAQNSPAAKIPLKITYRLEDKVILDILNTFNGQEWPEQKYRIKKED